MNVGSLLTGVRSEARDHREVVVVTGASGGVGRAVAHSFAKRGARVGLLARGHKGLDGAREEVESFGGEALAVPTDVADPGQVEAAAEAVEQRFGPIDIWVNDAMSTVFAPFLETTPEEYKRATEVTYLGFVYGTMSALKRMVPRDRGTVVQVGSALAYRAIPLQAPYCGGKFAIRGFTDSVRTELLHRKSRVWITMVQLPAVNTPQFNWCRSKLPNHPQPVPPIFQPEVPAEAIYKAAHSRRRELWVGGSAVMAIIGNKIAPGLADRYLARKGYSSQQVEDWPEGQRNGNLFEPVEDQAATHGIFDSRARDFSYETWATMHRTAVGAVAGGAVLAGAIAGLARARR
ncbi:MAG TPA: SDR family oxidoreductase [Candidatus Sulfotelmatobacter sp.]|nr:SDR family oxidoreductase [Candidatus Sulfotelmatobacter sp.]